MADFSGSGITSLPVITADTLSRGIPQEAGDPRLVDWIREAVQEGLPETAGAGRSCPVRPHHAASCGWRCCGAGAGGA